MRIGGGSLGAGVAEGGVSMAGGAGETGGLSCTRALLSAEGAGATACAGGATAWVSAAGAGATALSTICTGTLAALGSGVCGSAAHPVSSSAMVPWQVALHHSALEDAGVREPALNGTPRKSVALAHGGSLESARVHSA